MVFYRVDYRHDFNVCAYDGHCKTELFITKGGEDEEGISSISDIVFIAVSARAQHTVALPLYQFTQSVLDTTEADKPLLLMMFTARDGTEMRVFVFSYPHGVYMGEMLVLPSGRREFYPFEYEEVKPNEEDKGKRKVPQGDKASMGG